VSQVTDLKAVVVATSDVDAAVSAFRANFSLPVTRRSDAAASRRSTSLAIGEAEIEMIAATDPAGLYELVLEVADLADARSTLAARGIAADSATAVDGRPIVRISPAHTHGVRLVLVGR
jgi:hypothetical protein